MYLLDGVTVPVPSILNTSSLGKIEYALTHTQLEYTRLNCIAHSPGCYGNLGTPVKAQVILFYIGLAPCLTNASLRKLKAGMWWALVS